MGFFRIYGLKKRGLWRRLLCLVVDLKLKPVLNLSPALKKPLGMGSVS